MKKMIKIFNWVQNRFDNVWNEKYPKYWHIANLIAGLVCSITFVVTSKGYSTGTLIGLFFAIFVLGYLMLFSFTYGIVRARNGWTKKRK